jgi:hypothetical protein
LVADFLGAAFFAADFLAGDPPFIAATCAAKRSNSSRFTNPILATLASTSSWIFDLRASALSRAQPFRAAATSAGDFSPSVTFEM